MRNLWNSLRALLGRKITQRLRRTTKPIVEALEDRRLMTQRVWDGGGATNDKWSNRFNWEGNVAPEFNDDLVFPAGIGALDRGTNNDFLNGTLFNSITISGEDYALRGNRITLGAGGIRDQASPTSLGNGNRIEFDIALSSGQNLIDVGVGGLLSISGVISGAGDLVKTGPGTLQVTAKSNNTFTGKTILNGGNCGLFSDRSDGHVAVPGTLEINGGILVMANPNVISTNADVFLFGGQFFLEDPQTIGSLTVAGGTVKDSTQTLGVKRSIKLEPGQQLELINPLVLGASTTIDVAGGSTLTATGPVSGGVLSKVGTGKLVLNPQTGNNSYSTTTLVEGTLQARSPVAGRTVIPGNLNVGTGTGVGTATFLLDATNQVVADTATVSLGSRGLVSMKNSAQETVRRIAKVDRLTPRLDGQITVDSASQLTLKEDLTLAGATLDIGSGGARVTVLGPASMVRGAINIALGVLDLRNGLTMTGGAIDASAANAKVLLTGNVTTNANATAATINGHLELTNGSHTFQVANGGADKDLLINAVIQNGARANASVIKAGPGKLELKGNNTYTGTTTVNSGILLVNGTNAANQDTYRVDGGEIRGFGTISKLNVASGIVSPGDGGGGLFKVLGSTSLSGSAKYVAELDGTTVPAFDQIRTNTLFLDHAFNSALRTILEPKLSFTATVGQNFRLIDVTGSTPLGADQLFQTVDGVVLNQGQTFTADNQNFTINYHGGDGNDIVITRNTGPAFANRKITPKITEGQTAFITGHITEPNHQDTFFLDVDWGDGTQQTFTFLPGSPKDIKVGHRYLDNPRDDDHYDVKLLWRDQHGGQNTAELETIVHNKAPILGQITASLPPFSVGQPITIRSSVTDAPLDTFKVHVRWDLNGPWQAINLPAGTKFFQLKHTYAKAGDHHVTILLIDDDLDFDQVSFLLNVS